MEVELPVPVESRIIQADRPRDVPVIVITSPLTPTCPVKESSARVVVVLSNSSVSAAPGPTEEAWQEEARALPQVFPVVVPLAPPPEGIPEPVYLERQMRAQRENLECQMAPGKKKKKKRKRRGPRQLQMDDYEGAVPRPQDQD